MKRSNSFNLFSIVMCNLWHNLQLGWRRSVFGKSRSRSS